MLHSNALRKKQQSSENIMIDSRDCMSLQFEDPSQFLDLHGSIGLTDWDMDDAIKLTTTTDQFCQDDNLNDQYLAQWHYARRSRKKPDGPESLVQTNLWLWVNPNLVCPIKYSQPLSPPPTPAPVEVQAPQTLSVVDEDDDTVQKKCHGLTLGESDTYCHPGSLQDGTSGEEEYQYEFKSESGRTGRPFQTGCNKGRTAKARRKDRLPSKRSLQHVLQDSKTLKPGGWRRPPVNYCVLIAMALSSSLVRSLNVQQIYNFIREHFPFFQTAPDGWKNTIRHNLCFSNSFRKTPHHQQSRDGKRKSCLWQLTLDGRQRLRDEIQTMTSDVYKELKKSMSHPGIIPSLSCDLHS